MKIKFKITALFTLLVTAILLLLSFSIYYFISLERRDAFKNRLRGRANNSAQIFSLFGDSSANYLSRIDAAAGSTLQRKSVAIYNYLNQKTYEFTTRGEEPVEADKDLLTRTRLNKEVYYHQGDRDVLVSHHTDSLSRVVVMVAAYDEDGWMRLHKIREILLVCLTIGVAITLIVGFVFSTQLVKPITQIIYEVKDISSQNLSHRIHAGESQDELNQLANTFNDLLDRLQESFNIQRRFISNASHELSTPLTSISSQLEVTLHRERSVTEYQQVMLSIRDDVRQMQQLTKSLLEIAKTGSQGGTIELIEVRVDEVLMKVMADVRKISPVYQIELHFGDFPEDERECVVIGNSDLLYMSVKNIVENGCKYSPDHTTLVTLEFKQQEIVIVVKNHGEAIPEEEMEHIFQPFYRGTTATNVTKGFGLGLALAKRIISLHKGNIEVQSDSLQGTMFTIILPSIKVFTSR